MEGIQFQTDEHGQKTAVVIDLVHYGELWEDFYDTLVAESRIEEPRESFADVKARLRKKGKLAASGNE